LAFDWAVNLSTVDCAGTGRVCVDQQIMQLAIFGQRCSWSAIKMIE
jgi:hypothetical protein